MGKQSNIVIEQGVLSSDSATPASGYSKIYPKSDGAWYVRNADGTIKNVTDQFAPAGVTIHYNYFKQGTAGVTLGQTLFAIHAYTVGSNSCWAILNGSKLILIAGDYAETNSTHITLASGLSALDDLEVVSFELSTGTTSSIDEDFVIAMATAL